MRIFASNENHNIQWSDDDDVRLIQEMCQDYMAVCEQPKFKELENELASISFTRGNIEKGTLIIAKGEVVEAENHKILNSLKQEYESELWSVNNYYFILFGYTILVALVLMMLLP